MIIAQLSGGLGNQFFQYALGRSLAEKHHTEFLLDTTSYGPDGDLRPQELAAFTRQVGLFQFHIKARVAQADEIALLKDDFYRANTRDRAVRQLRRIWPGFLWNSHHRLERQYRFQPEVLDWPDDVYFRGYWQSPKYFETIAPLLREELVPTDAALVERARETVEALKTRYGKVVSLHVRRGDVAHAAETLGKPHLTQIAPLTLSYITQAMAKFAPETCFLVFSDTPKDIAWCRENIQAKNLAFSDAASDIGDFTAMGFCDHHIIANSTFSWWAAWLNARAGKRVVAPKVWSIPGAKVAMVTDDLLPADWETL